MPAPPKHGAAGATAGGWLPQGGAAAAPAGAEAGAEAGGTILSAATVGAVEVAAPAGPGAAAATDTVLKDVELLGASAAGGAPPGTLPGTGPHTAPMADAAAGRALGLADAAQPGAEAAAGPSAGAAAAAAAGGVMECVAGTAVAAAERPAGLESAA